jgi:hypothetical protein
MVHQSKLDRRLHIAIAVHPLDAAIDRECRSELVVGHAHGNRREEDDSPGIVPASLALLMPLPTLLVDEPEFVDPVQHVIDFLIDFLGADLLHLC